MCLYDFVYFSECVRASLFVCVRVSFSVCICERKCVSLTFYM